MRIEHLEYLASFAETGSVSEAARAHFMTEQGMSRALRQLEREVGVPLFVKSGKSLKLTEAGKALVDGAQRISNEYRLVQDRLDLFADASVRGRRVIDLYVTPLVGLCVMPLLNLQSPRQFGFAVNVYETNLDDLTETVRAIRDGLALSIVSAPPGMRTGGIIDQLKNEGLVYHDILESEVIALVSSSSPLARGSGLNIRQFIGDEGSPLGIACLNDRAVIDPLLDVVRRENLRLVTNNLKLIKRQVRSGQVVLFLPDLAQASMHMGNGIVDASIDAGDLGVPSVRFGLVTGPDGGGEETRTISDYVTETLSAFIAQQDEDARSRLIGS